ncbi:hypothetical protein GCM10010329_81450 [Streptomyces spiroverticillatus]|uniref:Restriction endonuclease n=1 Tax=Streptomyces finlayi TaxID=67296 RepID=A0A919CF09_9ACTN|nr:restriction endonuclease [Streptomyces finlayi]GHA46550.1 hypothetical protein GCM10010329_81450 [Streptomyces spiroverticillatus]GHD16203.1 hypothetical protein GCM10010334_77060 [Streptomyces finlayi]
MTHQILHDPDGHLAAELPLDPQARTHHETLAQRVLGWGDDVLLSARDLELIALLLTGHARCVRDDVRQRSEDPRLNRGVQGQLAALADDADRQLNATAPPVGEFGYTRGRARLVLSLYAGLDLAEEAGAASPRVTAHP